MRLGWFQTIQDTPVELYKINKTQSTKTRRGPRPPWLMEEDLNKNLCLMAQTDTQMTGIATLRLNWPSGRIQ